LKKTTLMMDCNALMIGCKPGKLRLFEALNAGHDREDNDTARR